MTTLGTPKGALAEQMSNIGKLLGYVGWMAVTAVTLVSNGILVVLGAIAFAVVGLFMMPFIGAVAVASGARRATEIADRMVDRRMWIPLSIMAGSLAVSVAIAFALAFTGFPILIPAVVAAGTLVIASIYTLSDFRIYAGLDQPGWAEPVTVPQPKPVAQPAGIPADVARLWHTDIFRNLTQAQMDAVAALGTVRRYDEGAVLVEQDRMGDRLYAVIEGKAQLTSNTGLGPVTVRVVSAGDSFPLASLVGYGLIITSASAMTAMTVWEVDCRRLLSHCNRNPETGSRIFATAAAVLTERYRDTLTRLALAAEQAVEGVETRVTI